MKLLSASIFVSSLILSVSLYWTFSQKSNQAAGDANIIDKGLLPEPRVITEEDIREAFMTDTAQSKLKRYFEAGNSPVKAKEIHSIKAANTGEYVVVEYLYEDRGLQRIERVHLSKDEFGNLVTRDFEFPIIITGKLRSR